jgi:DNA-binding CsgD family transcriptional regulator
MTEVNQLEERYGAASNAEAIRAILAKAVSDIGFRFYSYLSLRVAGAYLSEAHEPIFLTNYPAEWRNRYLNKSYYFNDPVSVLGSNRRLPFKWGCGRFLQGFKASQKIVFYEAREFGVTNGYTLPVHGPKGECGLFTVVTSDTALQFDEAISEAQGDLHVLSCNAHALCMERVAATAKDDEVELSAREKECLIWTARGKTSDDIAEIINRSTPTVNYHLQKAMRKLNAVNKFQATIKAYERHLLN